MPAIRKVPLHTGFVYIRVLAKSALAAFQLVTAAHLPAIRKLIVCGSGRCPPLSALESDSGQTQSPRMPAIRRVPLHTGFIYIHVLGKSTLAASRLATAAHLPAIYKLSFVVPVDAPRYPL